MLAMAKKLPVELIIKSVWFEVLWLIAVIGRESFIILLGILLLITLFLDIRNKKLNPVCLLLLVPCVLVDYQFYFLELF